MSTVKKQHYVPQFYLRQFASSDEQIHVYDKFQQKAFPSNVRDIAGSNYFYDLSLETIEHLKEGIGELQSKENWSPELVEALTKYIEDVQIIERYLSRLEARFAETILKVLYALENWKRFEREFRIEVAQMAALQYWRTQERREEMLEMEEKLEKSILDMVQKMGKARGVNYTLKDIDPDISFDPEKTKARHKMILFDQELLEETAQSLKNHIWIIGVNETNSPFYTSDNPISRQANKKDDWRSNSGIASPGILIAFPLSPKYNLIMLEKSYFYMFQNQDGTLKYLKPDEVIFYNSLQVYSSYRQIYSMSNNFELTEEMLDKEPELKTQRPRWRF